MADRIEALEGALRPFAETKVLEPTGKIIGLERHHFERARSILSNKGDSDRAAALSELAENDAYILDHENAALKARGIE